MDIEKYVQIKHRVRHNNTFQAAEVGELICILDQYRRFVQHLRAYMTTSSSYLTSGYKVLGEANRLFELIGPYKDVNLSKEQKAALDVLIDGGLTDAYSMLCSVYYDIMHMGEIMSEGLLTCKMQDYIDSKVAKE